MALLDHLDGMVLPLLKRATTVGERLEAMRLRSRIAQMARWDTVAAERCILVWGENLARREREDFVDVDPYAAVRSAIELEMATRPRCRAGRACEDRLASLGRPARPA